MKSRRARELNASKRSLLPTDHPTCTAAVAIDGDDSVKPQASQPAVARLERQPRGNGRDTKGIKGMIGVPLQDLGI